MTVDAKEALKRLGISEDVLLPKEEIMYNELVKQCRELQKIPSIGMVAKAAGISLGTYARLVNKLVTDGRVISIGQGRYVPVVEADDVSR